MIGNNGTAHGKRMHVFVLVHYNVSLDKTSE